MIVLRPAFAAALLLTGSAAAPQEPDAPPAARTDALTVASAGGAPVRVGSIGAALAAARALRREHPDRAVVLTFPAGVTRLAAPIALVAADSGTAASPLVLRGAPGGSTLSGARVIAAAGAGDIHIALPGGAPAAGYRHGGQTLPPAPALWQGRTRIEAASWPAIPDGQATGRATGWATGWTFAQRPDGLLLRPATGALPPIDGPVTVEGFFGEDWAFEASPARREGDALLLPGFTPAFPMRAQARLRIRGAGATLAPGRYAPEGDGVRLRPAPPEPASPEPAPIERAVAPALLTMAGVAHVRVEGLAFEKSAGTAIAIAESSDVALVRCRVARTGDAGITVDGGARVTIDRCAIDDVAGTAVRLSGGHRPSLTPAGHALTASRVTRFARALPSWPGIALWGVGNAVVGNRIAGGPHAAISLYGNDHRIAGNEIAHAVCETRDAGAIYMGRDWTQRGNVVAGNYLHDIGPRTTATIVGVYLDDQFSGTRVERNVFFRMAHAVLLGGGRDTLIAGNVFARTWNSAISYDTRGTGWQRDLAAPGGQLRRQLAALPYREAPWRVRYPTLAALPEDRPGEPVGNAARANAFLESQGVWAYPTTLALPLADSRYPVLTPAEWAALDNAGREDAYAILARAGGLPPDPPWRALPEPRVPRCGG